MKKQTAKMIRAYAMTRHVNPPKIEPRLGSGERATQNPYRWLKRQYHALSHKEKRKAKREMWLATGGRI